MTTMTPAIASPDMLFLSGRHAARYATSMPRKQDDPLYTTPRFTTAQAAEMLGISRVTVQAAIRRGRLESELASPNVRLISQAAIDAYRANNLGQVGQPSRQRQRMLNKVAEAQARKAVAADGTSEAPTGAEESHD
jgi:excisionase family DNA binding protein